MSLWIGQMEPFAGSIGRYFLSPGQEISIPVSCQIFAGGRTIEKGHQDAFLVELWTDLNSHDAEFSAIPMTFRGQSDLYYEYEGTLVLKTCGAFRFTVRFSTDGGRTWIYQNDFYQGDKPCLDAFLVASAAWVQEASVYSVPAEALGTDDALTYVSTLGANVLHLPAHSPEGLDELIKKAHSLGLKVVIDFAASHAPSHHPKLQEALEDPQSNAARWFHFIPDDRLPFEGYAFPWNFGCYSDEEDWIEFGSFDPALWEELINTVPEWIARHGIDGVCCEGRDHIPVRFWQKAINAIKKVKPDAIVIARSGDSRLLLRAFDVVRGDFWQSLQGFPTGRDIKYSHLGRDSQYPKRSWYLNFVESPETGIRAAVRWGSGHTAFLRFAIVATTPGLPVLQHGQEVADVAPLAIDEIATDWRRLVEESDLLHRYAKLLKIRRELPTLCRGRTYFLNMEPEQDSIFAFLRYDEEGAVLVAVNLDPHREQSAAFRLPIWEMKLDSAERYFLMNRWDENDSALYSGQHLSAGLEITLPPNGLLISSIHPETEVSEAGLLSTDA